MGQGQQPMGDNSFRLIDLLGKVCKNMTSSADRWVGSRRVVTGAGTPTACASCLRRARPASPRSALQSKLCLRELMKGHISQYKRNVLEFAKPKTWWKRAGDEHVNDAWQTVSSKQRAKYTGQNLVNSSSVHNICSFSQVSFVIQGFKNRLGRRHLS